jgi:hypothetical protein
MSEHINGQPHDRTALILYGSETGNSQEAAEQLGRITERFLFLTKVIEMDAIDLVRLFLIMPSGYISTHFALE